jgi:hypothetical protein
MRWRVKMGGEEEGGEERERKRREGKKNSGCYIVYWHITAT